MFRKYGIVLMLAFATMILAPVSAFAQEDAAAGLSSAVSSEFGVYLATSEGLALYQYVEDGENVSACTGSCVRNWHPLLVGADGEVALEGDVDATLVGTFEREDGSIQVSYAGQPVYTSRHDTPGDTRGQQVGRESFNLISLSGAPITEAVVQEAVELDADVLAQLMEDGANVYRMNCVACHGAEAQGGVGPGLAANPFFSDSAAVIDQILNGFPDHGMPAFAGILDDYQIASLLTYLRGSFGNEYGPVLEEEVAQRR